MIPRETVQQILDAARIEEVVGDYVTLKRRGSDWWGCCPFHNEKTPSFHVVPSKGIYYCFGCHKGGSAVGFIMEYEHLSWPEALKHLARKYKIEVVEEEEDADQIARRQRGESLMLVSEFAAEFFRKQLRTDEGKSIAVEYFHSRGLEDSTIEKYGLGWAPVSRHALTDAAKAAGYKDEYLLETGLCASYDGESGKIHDRFYDRVVFPIHSVSGRVVAFGARTLRSKEDGKPYAKYVNSKESEIYVKNRSLYGLYFAKKAMGDKDKCYLVEGYLDVLSMHQLGITNVVASSGTALTEGQIGLIKRFTRNVTIMYDGDSAGIHAALRGIDMFLREDMNVRVVLIPDGDDPDSYSRKHTLSEVEDFLASSEQDFMSFKAAQLMQGTENDPIRRAEVINEIGDTIALMPDAVKRSTYINFLNDRYSIHHDALERRVSATRRKIVEDEARARRREKDGSEAAAPSSLEAAPRPAEAAYQSPERAPQGLESLEENPVMGKAERDLLNFILANGTTPLKFPSDSEFYSGEDTVQTVFDFITQALEADERTFENPAYKATYDAYSEEYYAGYTQAQIVKHLLDSEDRTVAYVTAQLSEDERYELSVKNLRDSMMNKGSWLTSYVPKAILVYQTCRLQCLIDAQMSALRQAQENGDAQAELDAMSEMMRLRNVLKAVKVKLGREKDSN